MCRATSGSITVGAAGADKSEVQDEVHSAAIRGVVGGFLGDGLQDRGTAFRWIQLGVKACSRETRPELGGDRSSDDLERLDYARAPHAAFDVHQGALAMRLVRQFVRGVWEQELGYGVCNLPRPFFTLGSGTSAAIADTPVASGVRVPGDSSTVGAAAVATNLLSTTLLVMFRELFTSSHFLILARS